MSFRVRDLSTHKIVPGLPTPFLIEQGRGDAFFVQSDDPNGRIPGVWYAKAKGYESPDGTYTRVVIEHTEDWRVDVKIQPLGEPEEEAYEDYFIVDAATEPEAFRLGGEKAARDVENRFGDDYGSDVTIIRARRGESI